MFADLRTHPQVTSLIYYNLRKGGRLAGDRRSRRGPGLRRRDPLVARAYRLDLARASQSAGGPDDLLLLPCPRRWS
jgi:hypothetical protein